jgi:uncharacterized protein YraI
MNRRMLAIALALVVLFLPAASALAQSPATLTATANLRIRSGPGVGYARIGALPAGASAQALGRDAGSSWAYVDYQGTRGWVAAWLATVSGDFDALPVTQPDGSGALAAAPSADSGVTAVPSVNLRVRSGPGTGYPTVTTIPAGTSVPVLGYDAAADWIRVDYNGQQGWSAAWLATINGDLSGLTGTPAADASSATAPPTGCNADGIALINAINQYRVDNGLGAIPISPSLCIVAEAHVNDLRDNAPHTAPTCNLHSWSDQGNWSACCYTPDHAQAWCAWNKPSELTDYQSNGYEIAYSGPDDTQLAVTTWAGSSGHNAMILNLGIWADLQWQAIGAAQHDGYAHVWFGTDPDPAASR